MAAAGATTAIEPAEGAPGPALVLPTETHRQIEDIVKKSGDRRWAVRKILRMGVLANQRVEYRKFGTSVLTGTMMQDGRVQCDCPKCQGKEIITCLAFEEHAGGYLRRPADSMYIIALGVSIRDFCFQGKDNPTDRERAANANTRKRKHQSKKAEQASAHAALTAQVAQQAVMAQHMMQQLTAGLPKGNSKPMMSPMGMPQMLDPAQQQQLQLAQLQQMQLQAQQQQQQHQQPQQHTQQHQQVQQHLQHVQQQVQQVQQQQQQQGGQLPQQQLLGLGGAQTWLPVSGGMVAQMMPGQDLMTQSLPMSLMAPQMQQRPGADPTLWRKVRNSNKHKRLFSGGPNCPLTHGEEVKYVTAQQEVLLKGTVCIDHQGQSGIMCSHCDKVISCSTFESHAGRGARRAPYDNIFNSKGESLRDLATRVPDENQPMMQPNMGMNLAFQTGIPTGQLASPIAMPPVSLMPMSSAAPTAMDNSQLLAAQSALVAQMNPHAFQAAMQQVQSQAQSAPMMHGVAGVSSPGVGQPVMQHTINSTPPQQ